MPHRIKKPLTDRRGGEGVLFVKAYGFLDHVGGVTASPGVAS
jgi:hypothetical protein